MAHSNILVTNEISALYALSDCHNLSLIIFIFTISYSFKYSLNDKLIKLQLYYNLIYVSFILFYSTYIWFTKSYLSCSIFLYWIYSSYINISI